MICIDVVIYSRMSASVLIGSSHLRSCKRLQAVSLPLFRRRHTAWSKQGCKLDGIGQRMCKGSFLVHLFHANICKAHECGVWNGTCTCFCPFVGAVADLWFTSLVTFLEAQRVKLIPCLCVPQRGRAPVI